MHHNNTKKCRASRRKAHREQALSAGLPPLPNDLPAATQTALLQLEALSDSELQQVVWERMGADEVEQFDELR